MKLIHLLRKELLESRKGMLIYGLTMFVVMLLPSVLTAIFTNPVSQYQEGSYEPFFFGFLFVGGFIITSLAFTEEMYGKSTQHNWMMLPASPLEKLTVKFLVTAIIYPIVLLAFISVSSLVIEGFNQLIFRQHIPVLNFFNGYYWKTLLYYIVAQSIFLMGSAYFRKAAFIKTVLMIGLVGFAIGLVSLIAGRFLFGSYFQGMQFDENLFINNYVIRFDSPDQIVEFRTFEVIGKVLFWVCVAPFSWIVSYVRIREVQAYDAV